MEKQLLVLHLGSNMGNRFKYLKGALKLLDVEFGTSLKISGTYKTKAWGNQQQPDFLNLAVIYETNSEPITILKLIKGIEATTGRKTRKHWHEREIDIDIIFYGNEIFKNSNLEIPHVQMQNRRFVLVPLNEICPEYIHPVLKLKVSELLKKCSDNLNVEKWENI
ncbi:MAG: 2-amino-4-hydroxy-6-hydroxymethyldihydropteridine diphosphokinase [Bacteroidia bacterium]